MVMSKLQNSKNYLIPDKDYPFPDKWAKNDTNPIPDLELRKSEPIERNIPVQQIQGSV